MKSTIFLFLIAAAWSCKGPSGERAVTGEASESAINVEVYDIYYADIENSYVAWVGARPASQHNGTVGLKEGHLQISNGEITGGMFSIDLQNIVVLDITDPGRNARLKGHLESDDFFDVPNHPEAIFEITDIQEIEDTSNGNTHRITGNLLIRGNLRSITFDASVDITEETVSAKSVQFVIDRTEWGVNYQSRTVFANLVDNFILDDLALEIHLTASRQQ